MNSQAPIKFNLWKVLLINAVSWLLILILAPIFIAYRTFIDLVLKLKLGEKYGGLFDREDALFLTPDDQSKNCIGTVFYIRSDKELDLFHKIRDIFQKKVFDNPEHYPKLTSSKREFGGYPYWIRNDCQVDDVVRPLKVPENIDFNEEYLKKRTAEIISAEHGKNGTVLWDVHVGEKPLKGDYVDKYYRYPMILRFQHAMFDGVSLVALYKQLFGDEASKNYANPLFNKGFNGVQGQEPQKTSMELINQYLSKSLKGLRLFLKMFFVALGRLMLANQLKPQDVNALHASKYTGEKIVAWGVEDVSLVKSIKNRTNTKFSSVVNAAVSASMTNYFKRNGKPVPDFMTGIVTIMLDFPLRDESKPVKLENKAAVAFVELPCIHKSKTLVGALENVAESINGQLKYSDALVSRLFSSSLTSIFPLKLIKWSFGTKSLTFLITNVPGMAQINILDGCIVERNFPIAPNGGGIGVTFTFMTHDNLLQVGLLVDKALIESQEEVQKMVDDLIYYIKMLDIESRNVYGDI